MSGQSQGGEPAVEGHGRPAENTNALGRDAGNPAPGYYSYGPPPEPAPPPAGNKARHVPGSVPAAVLILITTALSMLGNVMDPSAPRTPALGGLIVGVGLLFGGRGFRSWGVFVFSLGLVVMPIMFATGARGPAYPSDWIGLILNVGILLLLVGEPTRARVRGGIAVCVITLLCVFAAGLVEGMQESEEPEPPTSITAM